MKKYLAVVIGVMLAFIAGVILALVVSEVKIEVQVKESVEVTTKDGSGLPKSTSIEVYPGAKGECEFIIRNVSDATYGMRYKASVSSGAYSDLEIILELTGEDLSLSENKGTDRSVELEANIAPGEEHNLKVIIQPLPTASATTRTVKVTFTRGEAT
jgi:hypothetical protein